METTTINEYANAPYVNLASHQTTPHECSTEPTLRAQDHQHSIPSSFWLHQESFAEAKSNVSVCQEDTVEQQSEFEKFLKENNNEATLEAKVKFAQDIYLEAQEGFSEYTNPASTIMDLENSPLIVHRLKGISVDWFLDEFCGTKFVKALMDKGCQLWFLRNVGINEMLGRLGIRSDPFADPVDAFSASLSKSVHKVAAPIVKTEATIFVSYTGRFLIRHVVELLETLRGESMWMDLFFVDQLAWKGRKMSQEVKFFRNKLIENLPIQICGIGKVVLMVERWNEALFTLQ